MTENKLLFLKTAFPEYKVEFSDDFTKAVLYNPDYDENITVYYYADEADYSPFCVCFSFQHRHFKDEEDLIDWIKKIINGEKFAIEFLESERRRFGGEIEAKKLENLSYENLEQFSGYYGSTKLFEIADTFKVRGWKKIHNFDAVLIPESNGSITIKKSIKDNLSQQVKK